MVAGGRTGRGARIFVFSLSGRGRRLTRLLLIFPRRWRWSLARLRLLIFLRFVLGLRLVRLVLRILTLAVTRLVLGLRLLVLLLLLILLLPLAGRLLWLLLVLLTF